MDDKFFKQEWSDIKWYTNLAQKYHPLSTLEEKDLLNEYFLDSTITLSRKKKIKEKIVYHNMRLIIKIAKSHQYMGKGIPLIELIQEGILGLIYYLDKKYDIERGNKLMTGGVWWTRQKIGRCIENTSKVVKIPLHVQAQINKIRAVCREFSAEDIKPTALEISIRIKDKYGEDISEEEVKKLGRDQYVHTSLDTNSDDESQSSLLDLLTSNGSDELEEEIEKQADKDYVKELLSQLTQDEAKLITWKFGLIDYNYNRSNQDMANIMNMNKTNYKKFENQTLAKLRSLADRSKVNLT